MDKTDCCSLVKDCIESEDCHWFRQFVVINVSSPDPDQPVQAQLPTHAALAHDPSLAKEIVAASRDVLANIHLASPAIDLGAGGIGVPKLRPKEQPFDYAPLLPVATAWFAAMAAATPAARWAIGVRYRHCWRSKGYHRGALVKSIALAPGETVQVTVKTWDKIVERTELTNLLERNVSHEVSRETKWSLAAKTVLGNQTNLDITPSTGLNGEVGLPSDTVTGKAGGNVGLTGAFKDQVSQTAENSTAFVQDQMIKSAESLKVSRTNKVDITRDSGVEGAVTQSLANPNACHALAFHYFEVLQEFEITTAAESVTPYLLTPLTLPEVTPEWVLCHECYLRRVLFCDRYADGFDAARTLLVQQAMDALRQDRAAQAAANNAVAGNAYGAEVKAVLAAYRVMRDAKIFGAPGQGGDGSGLQNALDKMFATLSAVAPPPPAQVKKDIESLAGAVADHLPHLKRP